MAARYRQPASKASTSPTSDFDPAKPIKDVADDTTSTNTTSNPSGNPSENFSGKLSGKPTGLTLLDILRILGGLFLLSCSLSHLSTSGESLTWGYNAWWTRARDWKAWMKGTVHLTDTQLLAYDGTNPQLPIYLAINGTIYDVSISPQTYGPGGSYHFFAGRDAARSFLTGCFKEDQTPDLRGVERMFMPIDPEEAPDYVPDADAAVEAAKREKRKLSKGEIKNRHAQELRKARKQMRDGLENWHKMFRGEKGKKYFKVGEVVREEGWLEKLPRRELCAQAEKGRPVRKEG